MTDRRKEFAARRWARKLAILCPGVYVTAQVDGRSLTYVYDGRKLLNTDARRLVHVSVPWEVRYGLWGKKETQAP